MHPENIGIYTSIGVWMDTVFGILNLHLLFCGSLGGKLRRKTTAVCLSALVIAAVLSFFLGYRVVAEGASFFVVILLPLLTVAGLRKRTMLYDGLLYMGVALAVYQSVYGVVSLFTSAEWWPLLVDGVLDVGWLCLVAAMATGKIPDKIFRQAHLLSGGLKALLLAATFGCGMLLSLSRDLFQLPQGLYAIVLGVLIVVLVVLVCIACPLLIINHLSNHHYQTLSESMTQQVDAQVQHYEELARANEDVRAFRHDFKNWQISLQQCLQDNDIESAQALLQQYGTAILQDAAFQTGHRVADALLTAKQEIAIKQETTVSFFGRLSASLPSTDVCILLGNAVDNALEACQKLPADQPRNITITAHSERGMQFLQIENPLPPDVTFPANGKLPTTKADATQHGFGVAAMEKVVGSYHGTLQFICQNGLVRLEIEFSLP